MGVPKERGDCFYAHYIFGHLSWLCLKKGEYIKVCDKACKEFKPFPTEEEPNDQEA